MHVSLWSSDSAPSTLLQELMAYVHTKVWIWNHSPQMEMTYWMGYSLSVHWNTYNFEKVNLVLHPTAWVNLEQMLSERSQMLIKSILCGSTYVGF